MKDLGIGDHPIFTGDLELIFYHGSTNRNPSVHFKHSVSGFLISFHGVSAISITDAQNKSSIYSRFDKFSTIFIENDNYSFDFAHKYISKTFLAEENKRFILCTRN